MAAPQILTGNVRVVTCFALGAWLALRSGHAFAAERLRDAPSESGVKFSLLPKSFQKSPWLDFNVITEFTREGRAIALPTTTNPAYYTLQAGSMVALGASSGGEHPPPVEDLRRIMQRALAGNHYLEATAPESRSTLVIVFNYGSAVSDHQLPEEVADATRAPPQTAEELLPFLIRGQDNELNRVVERAILWAEQDLGRNSNRPSGRK